MKTKNNQNIILVTDIAFNICTEFVKQLSIEGSILRGVNLSDGFSSRQLQ